ncbi:helicase-related protein [Paenibacillus filicis]|uniref:Helicase-related protein n=1 Tax=Paenibacillus filicis TaxID=669464 RepID=A0ABU9DUH4_9BACL
MRAFVYALDTSQGTSWHVSIHLEADRDHWVRVHGGAYRLRVLEPSLSFGQACRLKLALEEGSLGRGPLDRPSLLQAASRAGVRRSEDKPWRLWDWSPGRGSSDGSGGRVDIGALLLKDREKAQLSSLLEGRRLLMEELDAMLSDRSQDGGTPTQADPNRLKYALQREWLSGFVRLEPGIRIRSGSGRGLLRIPGISARGQTGGSVHAACVRCGGEGEASVHQRAGASGQGQSSIRWTECPHCGELCPYCEDCLTMGRVRYCSPLISRMAPERIHSSPDNGTDWQQSDSNTRYTGAWGLSNVQEAASDEALNFLKANNPLTKQNKDIRRFLIWAVTGAGKTEMIFPMIQFMIEAGKRVAVVTPRKDVVLELQPRLAKAFPDASRVTLYGGSEQRWEQGMLMLATTHQMLRFHQAFDLVIVDEIDAYPYHNNPMLLYAVDQVCKPGGAFILLSATPPPKLQREVRLGRLPHVRVPARFHRHPLPEPRIVDCPQLKKLLQTGSLPAALKAAIRQSLERGAQVFIFVPNIKSVDPFVRLLRGQFGSYPIEGTSSKDEERSQKVVDFRAGTIRLLVTTTILERGVTIPKSDVYIIEAGSVMFDAAALVQMAGRAGRSAQDPNGFVYFASPEKTRSQAEAIRQIKSMNKLARQKGYIELAQRREPLFKQWLNNWKRG